jgi:hypothetical protein
MRPLLHPWLAVAHLLVLLLITVAPAMAAAQNIAEVAFDGLPDGVTADSITAVLSQKAGATYDKGKIS